MAKEEEQLNAEIKAWTKMVRKAVRRRLQEATKSRTKTTQLKTKTRRFQGEIERVSFQMPRHLVFFSKGVGRGWPISRQKQSGGSGARQPKPFVNPVLEQHIKDLADRVQKQRANVATKNIKIK